MIGVRRGHGRSAMSSGESMARFPTLIPRNIRLVSCRSFLLCCAVLLGATPVNATGEDPPSRSGQLASAIPSCMRRLLRWLQFDGQFECLRAVAKGNVLWWLEVPVPLLYCTDWDGGVTSGEPRGLHGPRHGIDPGRRRTQTACGPPPRVPVGCRDCGTCGSSIVPWPG